MIVRKTVRRRSQRMEQDNEADLLPNDQGSQHHRLKSRIEPDHSSDERFDASPYAFFGRDLSLEVELGGLDEQDDTEQEISEDVDGPYSLSSAGDVLDRTTLGSDESGTRSLGSLEPGSDCNSGEVTCHGVHWTL